METSLRLERTEKLDGSIWFYIMHDSTCLKSIEDDPILPGQEEARARLLFGQYKERELNGYPKTVVLDEYKIPDHAS